MGISTYVAIKGGYYGKYIPTPNGTMKFVKLGREAIWENTIIPSL